MQGLAVSNYPPSLLPSNHFHFPFQVSGSDLSGIKQQIGGSLNTQTAAITKSLSCVCSLVCVLKTLSEFWLFVFDSENINASRRHNNPFLCWVKSYVFARKDKNLRLLPKREHEFFKISLSHTGTDKELTITNIYRLTDNTSQSVFLKVSAAFGDPVAIPTSAYLIEDILGPFPRLSKTLFVL